MNTINLEELTGSGRVRNLSGHDKGVAARGKFDLETLDSAADPVLVVIPDYVYAVSSSFVQGMFAESLAFLGSIDLFFGHYQFDARGPMIKQIERGLAGARLLQQQVIA